MSEPINHLYTHGNGDERWIDEHVGDTGGNRVEQRSRGHDASPHPCLRRIHLSIAHLCCRVCVYISNPKRYRGIIYPSLISVARETVKGGRRQHVAATPCCISKHANALIKIHPCVFISCVFIFNTHCLVASQSMPTQCLARLVQARLPPTSRV